MPLIKSRHGMTEGLVSVENKGDKTIFTHAQDVMPTIRSCYELRKNANKGMSEDRTMQHIARIPELVFFAHPELVEPSGRLNKKEFYKFLKTPEGELYRTSEGRI